MEEEQTCACNIHLREVGEIPCIGHGSSCPCTKLQKEKGKEETMPETTDTTPIGIAREHMDLVLQILRKARADKKPEDFGTRELAEAITHFETGCMWMIRSQFADKPYSPLLKLKEVNETT